MCSPRTTNTWIIQFGRKYKSFANKVSAVKTPDSYQDTFALQMSNKHLALSVIFRQKSFKTKMVFSFKPLHARLEKINVEDAINHILYYFIFTHKLTRASF